ncbi:TIGR01777 family protein [bacterium]|nr:MAG: TIGR01777 family protein [bacterium]
MAVVVAGASGFVGRALVARLVKGGRAVRALSRSEGNPWGPTVKAVRWDPADAQGAWRSELKDAEAVINLCGENIAAGRWTAARKKAILDSRVDATTALARALPAGGVLVNVSAVGYYGARGDEVLTESSAPGEGFLADVCRRWEKAATENAPAGARVVLARLGVVLGPGGGALPRMALPFKLFAGGPVGDGKQWMPWVHLDDAVGALVHAAETKALSGPVNVVSPEAARNGDVSRALGAALGRPCWLPAPAFAFKIALGEMSCLLLDSQRVEPAALHASGYRFARPLVYEALKASF